MSQAVESRARCAQLLERLVSVVLEFLPLSPNGVLLFSTAQASVQSVQIGKFQSRWL